MNIYLYRASNLKYNHHYSGLSFIAKVNLWLPLKTIISCDLFINIIRECSSTPFVGLAFTAPPTNTNFRLTFLVTRIQEALYEDLPL